MHRTIAVVTGALAVTACAGLAPIGTDWSQVPESVRSETIPVVIVSDGTPFSLTTPGDIAGGGLIDMMTRPDGSELKLPAAAYVLAVAVREELAGNGRLQLGEVPNELTPWRSPKEPFAHGQPTLEVYADFSYLGYLPFAWSTYGYRLHGHARLLGSDGQTLWQNLCKVGGDDSDKSLQLGRAEFATNDGQRLKDIMKLAASRCAAQIARSVPAGKGAAATTPGGQVP